MLVHQLCPSSTIVFGDARQQCLMLYLFIQMCAHDVQSGVTTCTQVQVGRYLCRQAPGYLALWLELELQDCPYTHSGLACCVLQESLLALQGPAMVGSKRRQASSCRASQVCTGHRRDSVCWHHIAAGASHVSLALCLGRR
jgi:hypothetical protein